MSSKKHILVTGGAGFIGSHTVVDLFEKGYHPIIVDDFRNSNENVLKGIESITGEKPTLFTIDICNLAELDKIFNQYPIEGVIHFAAYKAVGESVEHPIKYYRNNFIGLLNCLDLIEKYNVPSFVFSSSCTVYGEPAGLKEVDEKTSIQPANSPYGNTKQVGEEIIQDWMNSGVECKSLLLRYFNPVGAHPSHKIGELPIGRPNNLFPIVAQTAAGKYPSFSVFGNDYNTIDGTCVRDYIHVCDLADAHVKGIEFLNKQEQSICEVVNVGTGKGTSVLETIQTFEKVVGGKINWEFAPRRKGDVPEIFANVDKSNELLNWKATKTVLEAVQDTWNWQQELKNV